MHEHVSSAKQLSENVVWQDTKTLISSHVKKKKREKSSENIKIS